MTKISEKIIINKSATVKAKKQKKKHDQYKFISYQKRVEIIYDNFVHNM